MSDRFPIFAALDVDWQVFIHSQDAAAAADRWRRLEPALASIGTVDDVLVLRTDRSRADAVLRALVGRAAWDGPAARVVLQALLPGLVRLAGRYADDGPDATASDLVAIAWERIASYPVHRPGAVAPNLLLDIRKQLLADRRPLGDLDQARTAPSAEDEALGALLFEELRAVERAGMGTDEAFDLIVASRVDGHSLAALAASCGVSPHGLLQRRRRAEHRLRRHLAAA